MNLYNNQIGPEGGVAIGKALAVNAVLSSLDLSGNEICGIDPLGQGTYSAASITALVEALKVNGGVLTNLVLRHNNIGDEGAKALAAALRVNEVLTSIDLRNNSLGDEGKGVIREAVSGRVGFELEM